MDVPLLAGLRRIEGRAFHSRADSNDGSFRAELEPFLRKTDTIAMLRKEGNLQVYESEAEFESSLAGWKARERHGIEFRHLNTEQMSEIQPGIAPRFTCGTFTPGWFSIADPKFYTLALADHFRTIGGRIECLDVASLRPLEDGVEVVSHDGRTRKAGKVVLAAGAFSHRIARSLGEKFRWKRNGVIILPCQQALLICARRSPSAATGSSLPPLVWYPRRWRGGTGRAGASGQFRPVRGASG